MPQRVEWVGGPLDGCVDHIERPKNVWIGPDISDQSRVVVYALLSHPNLSYVFSIDLTEKANQKIEESRL